MRCRCGQAHYCANPCDEIKRLQGDVDEAWAVANSLVAKAKFYRFMAAGRKRLELKVAKRMEVLIELACESRDADRICRELKRRLTARGLLA